MDHGSRIHSGKSEVKKNQNFSRHMQPVHVGAVFLHFNPSGIFPLPNYFS
jgi:hypothetical protein